MNKPQPRRTWTRVERIRARLLAYYGRPILAPHGDPLAELVLTILSQATNDLNRDRAFLRLRRRFPRWEEVLEAKLPELEEVLRPGGIARVKAARLKLVLRAVADAAKDPAHPLSLDWLAEVEPAVGRAYLTALPGVGRKTAACVLLFSFGLPEVPVDTHVARVGGRLGLLPARAPSDELHDRMRALTPPGAELEFHVNLLRHGRRLCQARTPRCPCCPLRALCPSAA